MNDKIVAITFPTCGKCRFSHNPKNGMVDCFGMPPTPMLLGAAADALGRPQLHMEAMSPKVKEDRPGCHLHQVKLDFATSGRS